MPLSSWTPLHAKLHQTLRQRQLLAQQQPVLVAVSGGQDSLCLLKLLLDLQPKWQWQLAIAHCDHGWSSDRGIAEHVQKIARDWQIPCHLQVALPGEEVKLKETEAAARQWRYQALTEIAATEGFPTIVTGHTNSDRAETLLYNLIRGAGADGLGALTWQRPLTPQIQLVRPLLNISRQETGQFCQQWQISVWEDVVNKNLRYARNRLRAEVIPYLKTHFNPQVESAFAQTAELLTTEVAYLEVCAQNLLEQAIMPNQRSINRQVLCTAHLALQRRVIRQFLQAVLPKKPTFAQIEAVTNLINAPNRARTSSLPGRVTAEVVGDCIRLLAPSQIMSNE